LSLQNEWQKQNSLIRKSAQLSEPWLAKACKVSLLTKLANIGQLWLCSTRLFSELTVTTSTECSIGHGSLTSARTACTYGAITAFITASPWPCKFAAARCRTLDRLSSVEAFNNEGFAARACSSSVASPFMAESMKARPSLLNVRPMDLWIERSQPGSMKSKICVHCAAASDMHALLRLGDVHDPSHGISYWPNPLKCVSCQYVA